MSSFARSATPGLATSPSSARWDRNALAAEVRYRPDVAMIFDVAGRGRPRKRHVPDAAQSAHRRCWKRRPGGCRAGGAGQRAPEGPLCREARACRRRSTAADRRHGRPASPRRGGLTDRRTSLKWGAQVLSVKPTRRHLAHATGRCDQGALDLRAAASAVEGGTRSRPLRGTIMDRTAPARARP